MNGDENEDSKIEPGALVEATEGDLGEADVSKPRVEEVVRDQAGKVEKLIVKKGVIFQKKVEIPADRIREVGTEQKDALDKTGQTEATKPGRPGEVGKVVVEAAEAETEALSPAGQETLETKLEAERPDLLDQVEVALPTDVGLRKLEDQNSPQPVGTQQDLREVNASGGETANPGEQKSPGLLKVLGPGFLAGMAGNDASAVTSYSVDGATNGYGHLWLMLLSTPLYQAAQYACAKIGRITQKGLAEILKEHYGPWVAGLAALILIAANIALIAADLVAIGSGLQLVTGLNWVWFVIPAGLLLWYITVYQNYEAIKKIFLVMSLVFVTYLITAVISGADWGSVVKNTFIPQLDFSFASISSAVALLGATISPYNLFWQVQGEKEEQREGSTKTKLKTAALDIGSGVISGNLVAYAIIVSTSATIFSQHGQITTAADAARALEPLLGSFAKYLFAFGLIGAGLIAIPVLLASISYAITGTIGWPAGLSKKPWQNEGFYLILTVALVISLVIALIGLDPVQLMFWANVLNGVLAPVLVVFLLLVGNNRKIMKNFSLGGLTNLGLAIAAIIMFGATAILFYSLFTGQGG